jgi:hypothetical protein
MTTPQNQKDVFDYLTAFIAVWGAGLSTFIFFNERLKEKRSLRIILESDTWRGGHQIIITNKGFRPITVIGIHLFFQDWKKNGNIEPIRKGMFWDTPPGYEEPNLPKTLRDGENVTFYLSQYISNLLSETNNHLLISVYDSEMNCYKKYSESEYDQKYETHSLRMKTNTRLFYKIRWEIELCFNKIFKGRTKE